MINRRDILKLPACLALPQLPAISGQPNQSIQLRADAEEYWCVQLGPWQFFRCDDRCNAWFCGEKLTFDVGSNDERSVLGFMLNSGWGQAELGFRDGRLLIRRLLHHIDDSQFPEQIYYNDMLV